MTTKIATTTEMAEERTELGEARTLMAADRTLMAWVRTSLSMFSFSFSLYKILKEFEGAGPQLRHPNAPVVTGLVLAVGGIIALLMGIAEYWITIRMLKHYRRVHRGRATIILALFMLLSGMLLVFGMTSNFL